MISNQSGCQVEIDDLSLSWTGQQRAKGVRVQKHKDQLMITCEEVSTNASLLRVIFTRDVGELTLRAPNMQLTGPIQSSANLKKRSVQSAGFAAAPTLQVAMPAIHLPVSGKILISEGKMGLTSPGLEPISFDKIEMALDLMRENEIGLTLNCTTRQQQNLGQIALKGSASQLNSSLPNIALQASVTKLPVRGIDQLVAIFSPKMNGLIYAAIGPTVDMQCHFAAAQGDFDLSLNAQSAQINMQIATQTAEGIVSLKSPASFNFTLNPDLFQKMAKISPSLAALSLTQPALIQGTLSKFSCPLPTRQSDLLKSSFAGTVEAPPQMAFTINGNPLIFNSLHLDAKSISLEQEIDLALSTGLQMQTQIGSAAIDGKLLKPFSKTPNGSLAVKADKLPVDLIGIATQAPIALSTLLGPTVDLNGSVEVQEENPKLHLSWKSQFLTIPSFDLSLSNPWTLVSPASFTLGLNPQLAIQGQLKADPIQGTLQNVLIPTDSIKNSRINAVVNTGKIAFSGAVPLNISKLTATLKVNTFDQISLDIDGDPLKASLSGSFRPATSEFVLNKPLTAQYTLDNAMLKILAPNAPLLAKPAIVQLSLSPTSLPIAGFDLNKLSLKGQLASPEVALSSQGQIITLQNTTLPIQWDAKAKTAAIQLSSQVQTGSMQGQLSISNFSSEKGVDLNHASIQGSLDLQNLSAALLDAFSGKTTLSAITGPTFSGKLKLQSSIDKQNIAIKWVSPLLNIDSAFVIDKSAVQLQGGANQISWTLTPESYAILDRDITSPGSALIPFELSESSNFSISLNKLSLPVIPKKEIRTLADRIPDIAFDLTKLQLSATGHNPKLTFFDKRSKESIQLSSLTFSLGASADGGPLTVSLDSGVITQSATASTSQSVKNGSLSLSGKLAQTLNEKKDFDLSQLTGSLQLKVQQLPSRALDIVARAKGRTDFPFTTVFGDMINASITLDLKNFAGPVALNINTPMVRVDLDGHLVNGALLLNDALHAQMKITTELSRLILKEVNPLNLSYVYSQAPVTLEIPSEGFYFPLYPLNLGKIAIPEATIELGKIACRNEGNVNVTLGLLKSKQFDKNGELSLWFAPIDLSIKQGFADIERTEILLADTYDICLWGKVDIVQDYVDMVLGLTAQTLSKAFGIKNLPENYVLTLPMKGPSDNVQINSSKATAKVALLLAWQNKNIAGAFGGGQAGAVVGDLLGKIATLPDSDAKVPPAKHPFPWEIGKGAKTSDASHEKKRQFKANEKPLKQILKVIR